MRADKERWLAGAFRQRTKQKRAGVFTVGAEPVVDRALSTEADPPRLSPSTNVNPSSTNIASAVRAGLAVLPPSSARRLVLLSDGQEHQEKADTAAALAAAAGGPLTTPPRAAAPGP